MHIKFSTESWEKMKPYPLQFQPVTKERVWGGRALKRFGLQLPQGQIGEGWMIGDHPHGTTKVINGEWSGLGLDQIREQYGQEVFGKLGFSQKNGRFPLLLKLLDCQDDLSIQVHPDDDYRNLTPGELGKTEMWYVLDAKPGAQIIYGLNEGTTREALAEAIREDRIMECLRFVPATAGDSFYIPAGTVHALMSGVVVAEVQQNSDTTYRLYDYHRPGLDGLPRELHIEDSLNVIRFDNAGAFQRKAETGAPTNQWQTLVKSPYFVTEKAEVTAEWNLTAAPESFTLLMCCHGQGELRWLDGTIPYRMGDCFLLPAHLTAYSLQGRSTVLRSYIDRVQP